MLGFRTYRRPKSEPGFLCLSQTAIELSHWVMDGKSGTNCMSPSNSHERPPSGRSASERLQEPGHSCQDPVQDCGQSEQQRPTHQKQFLSSRLLSGIFVFFFSLVLPPVSWYQCHLHSPPPRKMSYFPIILLHRVEKARVVKSS